MSCGRLIAISALLMQLTLTGIAGAQEDKKTDDDKPADPDTGQSTIEETTLGVLPNPLTAYGIEFAATYIGEVLGNASGGARRGTVYEGRLNLAVDADLAKLTGVDQLTFHANVFQLHGDGLSRSYLQNFMVVSGIEALPTTRLYEAWFEKKWGHNAFSLKLGQLAADTEFFNTRYTDVFTNASLGWPAITSINLPSGGPSPPLAALGARAIWNASESLSLSAAVFNGDAAGPGSNDPQERNRYGVNFRINDPPLVLGQVLYAWNNAKGSTGLTGSIRVGGWHHAGTFADQRWGTDGRSLADPSSNGVALDHDGNYGAWLVAEQQLCRFENDDDRGIGVFLRASRSPSDRNLIDYYADAGMEVIGPDHKRPHDKIGVAVGYAHVSKSVRALDFDYLRTSGLAWPIRDSETMITAAYQYEIMAGWSVQPSYQYIHHPAGGATGPAGGKPSQRLGNASVLGVRTVVKF